ncbi:MAG TPA: toprim domain-containing protein [Pseudomonas sp.]|nr:toprim domain-containing protein [Pseudomonas sp.]
MRDGNAIELIRQAAAFALRAADYLVPEWLPDGRRQGGEWVAVNRARGDRRPGSFGVSLETGRWNDFADDSAKGGDLVSLLAYLRECRQIEAAQEIDRQLGLGLFQSATSTPEPGKNLQQRSQRAEQERQQAIQQERERLEQAQIEAARQAAELWGLGKRPDRFHPYLKAKDVHPYGLRQLSRGRLLVPLCQAGRLVNLQTIYPNGEKRFLRGGLVKGCYSPLGTMDLDGPLYLCEGWATGATLHAHTRRPVACAMNAGNLEPVALALRERYGEALELVIAGDDDRLSRGNPGRKAANRAALAANALVVFPEWPTGAPDTLSDFNDLHLWRTGQYQEVNA